MANRFGATAKAQAEEIKSALHKPAEDYLSKENLDAAIDLLERFEYFTDAAELQLKCAKLWNTDGTRKAANDPVRAAGNGAGFKPPIVQPTVALAAAAKKMSTRAAGAQHAVDEIIAVVPPGAPASVQTKSDGLIIDDEKLRAARATMASNIAIADAERARRKPRIVDVSAPALPAIDLDAVAWVTPARNASRDGVTGLRVNKSRIRMPKRFAGAAYAYLRIGFVAMPEIDAVNDTLVLVFSAEPNSDFTARHRNKPEWGVRGLRDAILNAGYEPGDHELQERANGFLVVRSYQP